MTDRNRRDRSGFTRALTFVALATTWTAMGCAARDAAVSSCTPQYCPRIDSAIRSYEAAASAVNLNDPKERVLSLLNPSQADLKPSERRPADHFLQNRAVIEIFYFARVANRMG